MLTPDDEPLDEGQLTSFDTLLEDLDDGGDARFSYVQLEHVPRHLWRQTLTQLHPRQRFALAHRIPDKKLKDLAVALTCEIGMAEDEASAAAMAARAKARKRGAPLPTPGATHASGQPTVQVNLRLRADDHARLTAAAAAVGMKPTTLARAFVLNGAAAVLREHDAQSPSHSTGGTHERRAGTALRNRA